MKSTAVLLTLGAALGTGCASTPPATSPPAAPPTAAPESPPVAESPPAAPMAPPVPPREKAPAAPEAPQPAATPATPAGPRRLPEFQPSGIRADWKRCTEMENAVKAAKKLDEQAEAKKALADYLAGFPARWEGKDVPAPEACYYAVMLQKCRLYPAAAGQARRYIEVAPEDSPNFVNAHTVLIASLAQAGDFDGAVAELKRDADTVYGNHDMERSAVEETIANCMLKAGRVDFAAEHFRLLAENRVDFDAAKMAVDCYLRLDRLDDARRLAAHMTDVLKEGKNAESARWLVAQLDLIGKPAPGFAGAKWWKGAGGPLADADLKGKVTVVFSWNMKSAWNQFFFDRLAKMIRELEGRPLQVVGISRLARYDAVTGVTKADMTEEEELDRYDMWKEQYPVTYPLAVAGYQEGTLIDAWAAYVVPYFVVVGKDGIVCYVRTGKNEEHFAGLREMVERALAR